ncbi:MAG: hypothetical protein AVDCRST_MAG89-3427, partial [uncultured Gemmatimonadetes bacterium]
GLEQAPRVAQRRLLQLAEDADARVVHPRVDAPEDVHRHARQLAHRPLVAHVARQPLRLRPHRAQVVRDARERLRVARADHQPRPAPRRLPRRNQPDPAVRARDDDHL